MRLKIKAGAVVIAFLASSCGHAQEEVVPAASAYPPVSDKVPGAATSDQTGYDQVGYAATSGDELAGSTNEAGEIINPVAITISHASLPVPSYAEITNLDSGRTILARVSGRAGIATGRIVTLSKGAARQLGVEGATRVPVRVRRTNPPEFERAALRQGLPAGERIETPPALLGALRKMLGAAPVEGAAKPSKPVVKPVAKPIAAKPKPVMKAGAYFAPVPPAVVKPVPANDRFIEEDGVGMKPHWVNPSKPTKVAPVATTSAGLYIQVAAFGAEPRARALARQLSGSVVAAGSVYRVRTGPFATQAQATSALGQIRAKGYRDARVTR